MHEIIKQLARLRQLLGDDLSPEVEAKLDLLEQLAFEKQQRDVEIGKMNIELERDRAATESLLRSLFEFDEHCRSMEGED